MHVSRHGDNHWQVRVDGAMRGAGVLLDKRHVLAPRHVVGAVGREVNVGSAVCSPEWNISARVSPEVRDRWPGESAAREGDPWPCDVTLLELDEDAPCQVSVRLWDAPGSVSGRVRMLGFPGRPSQGIPAEAELGGQGWFEGELVMLNRLDQARPWIRPGYSGAGVLKLDGDHEGHVLGIVVMAYEYGKATGAWMMPTRIIRDYLPETSRFIDGEPADRLGEPDSGPPEFPQGNVLRSALASELTILLSDEHWTGTVMLPRGGDTGTRWLAELVRTTFSRGHPPGGAALGPGTIDAAYDARDRSAADALGYLKDRFGLALAPDDVILGMLRREPPVRLVINRADMAQDPGELVRKVLRPLSAGARFHGVKLVIGLHGPGLEDCPYDTSLDPVPLHGSAAAQPAVADVEQGLGQLAAAESDMAGIEVRYAKIFGERPRTSHARNPRLRVRLAVARHDPADPELALIKASCDTAMARVRGHREQALARLRHLEGLQRNLALHLERAARHGLDEHPALVGLHKHAYEAVWQAPVNLEEAASLVRRYRDEVERLVAGGGQEDGTNAENL